MASRTHSHDRDAAPDDRNSEEPEPQDKADADSPTQEWAALLLRNGSPVEVLRRILPGDPLGIEVRCRARIEAKAYLLDVQRLHLRAVARVARAAPAWNRNTSLDEFITERIDFSTQELVEEDKEEELAGNPCKESTEPPFRVLADVLGIPNHLARRACVAFNYLPERLRRAFFALVIKRQALNRYVAEGHGPPELVKADLEAALHAISEAIQPHFESDEEAHG